MSKKVFRLDDRMPRFLEKNPFFGRYSMYVNKRADSNIPTAGVTITKRGHFLLLYNPDFMASLTEDQMYAVLEHEFWHIILGHVTHRSSFSKENHKKWNVATDLCINSNQTIRDRLPGNCCIPERGPFKPFRLGETSEKYYFQLPNSIDDDMQFDCHDGWAETDESIDSETAKVADKRAKDFLSRVVAEVEKTNSWGNMPAELQELIRSLVSNKISWQAVLKFFVQKTIRGDRMTTRKKRNRRFGLAQPGFRRNRYAKIAIARDESGSVSNEFWATLTAEMAALAQIVEFTVLPFDTQVLEDNVYVWNKGEPSKDERVCCGGTCFDAPTNYVNERNFDGLIIMTDMYAPRPGPCKVPRLWITNKEGESQESVANGEPLIVID